VEEHGISRGSWYFSRDSNLALYE